MIDPEPDAGALADLNKNAATDNKPIVPIHLLLGVVKVFTW